MSQKITVTDMPRASYLEDGSVIEMEFKTSSGELITLCFAPEKLETWVSQTMRIVALAKNQKLSIGDHLVVQASDVVAVTAAAPVGGSKVILAIQGSNGIPMHYALHPEQSEQLRPELRKAEASAKAQKAQTRQ
jgi:hypothetical protein